MRILVGIILGIFLTLSTAYLYDYVTVGSAAISTNRPTTNLDRPLVNWGVLNSRWRQLDTRLRQGWRKVATN
jgi:hypothetical protein